MKLLVADDDRPARTLLTRLGERYLGMEVLEVEGGLCTLAEIERFEPDLLLLDVNLSELDGYNVLREVRRSSLFAQLTAVVTARSATRTMVSAFRDLGVHDILLKPYDIDAVQRRLTRLLSSVRPPFRRNRAAEDGSTDQSERRGLLLVDGDTNFRRAAVPLIAPYYDVTEASNGTAALDALANHPYAVVCVGEELTLLQGELLGQSLRRLETSDGARFIRLSSLDDRVPGSAFDDWLLRSWIPEQFSKDFRRVVVGDLSPVERLRALPPTLLEGELRSALRHTCGVLMAVEATDLHIVLPSDHVELRVRLTLPMTTVDADVTITLGVSDADCDELARWFGGGRGLNVSPPDALRELGNTVAGRLHESLLQRGFEVRMGLPDLVTHASLNEGTSLVAEAFMHVGARVCVALSLGVIERSTTPDFDPSVELF